MNKFWLIFGVGISLVFTSAAHAGKKWCEVSTTVNILRCQDTTKKCPQGNPVLGEPFNYKDARTPNSENDCKNFCNVNVDKWVLQNRERECARVPGGMFSARSLCYMTYGDGSCDSTGTCYGGTVKNFYDPARKDYYACPGVAATATPKPSATPGGSKADCRYWKFKACTDNCSGTCEKCTDVGSAKYRCKP